MGARGQERAPKERNFTFHRRGGTRTTEGLQGLTSQPRGSELGVEGPLEHRTLGVKGEPSPGETQAGAGASPTLGRAVGQAPAMASLVWTPVAFSPSPQTRTGWSSTWWLWSSLLFFLFFFCLLLLLFQGLFV